MENSQAEQKIGKKNQKERIETAAQDTAVGGAVPGSLDCFRFIAGDQPLFNGGLPMGCVIVDINGEIKSINQTAAEMIGIENFSLIKTNFINFVHQDDQNNLQFGENNFSRQIRPYFDIRLKKKQEFNWVRVYPSGVETSSCHGKQIRLILCDINDLKPGKHKVIIEELKKQLQQAQKMEAIGVLSSGIAHDFNNILQPIIGSLEILIDDAGEDKRLQETLKNILGGANRAGSLVKQILRFNHQADLEISPIKIQPIIREILNLSRSTLPANIRIIRTIDNACGPVMVDPTHIYQIAMNLITNAFHAMGQEEGTLDVMLKEVEITGSAPEGLTLSPGTYVCLSVADTGIGINDAIVDNIFDPYFTTKEKGTGLGLCVISDLVKKYGGNIRFTSKSGKGSLFQVYFPRETVPFNVRQDTASTQDVLQGNETIFIVDDDPFVVDIQKETFERYGYTVYPFVSSLEALNEFKDRSGVFDIVVCDMTMPDMTGLELAEKIKEIRPDIPVIICTGFSEQINQDSYQDLGIDGFLIKPARKENSLKLIRHLLDNSQK